MAWRLEQHLAFGLLDDAPLLHDANPMGDAPDQVEVVAYQQQGHAQACLQALEQLEDLQLDGDIERRGRLVGDQQLWLVGQRHGDHHALALPAGKLMGQGLEALAWLRDAYQLEQLERPRGSRAAGKALVQQQDFVDLLFDAVQRIERGHRFLKDHRDAIAANPLHGSFAQRQQVLPGMQDAAAGVSGLRVGQQAQDRVGGDRLARAAFADQGQGLALANIETDPFDHALDLFAGNELDRQVADFDQVALVHFISSGRRRHERTRR